jgi:branched-chain amino acid transport system permease protein
LFLQQLVNGLTVGSTYSLIALGYTLIFGVLGIINMAHGQVFIFGSFVGLVLMTSFDMPIAVAFIASIVVSGILGLILEYTAMRPLRKKNVPHLASLISTIGFAILLEEGMHKLFGADSRSFPDTLGSQSFQFGSVQIRAVDLIILGISVVLMIVLHFWINRTKVGKAIRATAENTETASVLGINTNMIIVTTVVLASSLGGIAGMLIGMTYSALIPTMGMTLGFKGLAVLILGGVGSIPGAMVCGLILGVIEVFTVAYGASSYRDAVAFGLIILILLIRPQGLLGRKA